MREAASVLFAPRRTKLGGSRNNGAINIPISACDHLGIAGMFQEMKKLFTFSNDIVRVSKPGLHCLRQFFYISIS